MCARRRGILMAETLLAMALVGILLTLLVAATSAQRSGARALAERRELVRAAAQTVHVLQRGDAKTLEDGSTVRVTLEPLPGTDIGTSAWARVTASRGDREASLIALVPRQAVDAFDAREEGHP